MFYQLLFIHLFRPFLKYKHNASPLPAHVSPRKILTHAACMISKLLRIYKRTHGLRQICNIAVYIAHTACTIHLLNLPDKTAARDIVHGLKHLEEIAESWLCSRRTIGILHLVAKRWSIELPEEADKVFSRAETKFGSFKYETSSNTEISMPPPPTSIQPLPAPVVKPNKTTGLKQNANTSNGANSASDHDLYASTSPLASPMPTTHAPNSGGTFGRPQQSAAELGNRPGQHQFTMPQALQQQPSLQQQQGGWNPNHSTSRSHSVTSPTMLFGGVDSLIQDQEWWLRDSNQMFANWNGVEQDSIMSGTPAFDTRMGNMNFVNASYGLNGNMMGNGNMGYRS